MEGQNHRLFWCFGTSRAPDPLCVKLSFSCYLCRLLSPHSHPLSCLAVLDSVPTCPPRQIWPKPVRKHESSVRSDEQKSDVGSRSSVSRPQKMIEYEIRKTESFGVNLQRNGPVIYL